MGRTGQAADFEVSHAGPALGRLALARGDLDRATVRRADEAWVSAAWAEPRTRVLVMHGDRAQVRFSADATSLVLVSSAEAPADGLRLMLGVDEHERAYFAAATPDPARATVDGGATGGQDLAPPVRWAGLREAGPLLGDRDAGLLTHAVALANWHASHTHCPRCGTPTLPAPAGHLRTCPADGSEHFPRVDPAVIMIVTDDQDRCLLAHNRRWPANRVSILAGFVEPGESAEQAVAREIMEEVGVSVDGVRYLGSQPWPMPQSLMLGFWADAVAGQAITVDAQEIAEARWYSRGDVAERVAAGTLLLPPPVSIAHHILQAWYGQALPAAR